MIHVNPRIVASKRADIDLVEFLSSCACGSILQEYGVTTKRQQAHFYSQIAHETGGFRWLEERESIYTGPDFILYEPGKRVGKRLGNTEKGDGKRFRGRGLIQLTGRYNYSTMKDRVGVDLLTYPDKAASDPQLMVKIALEYWKSRDLIELSKAGTVEQVTLKINGGYNGLADRKRLFRILES